jgi:hypothetical protein
MNMKSVLETCIPRKSILKGTFNPEVFTASLSPVIQYYRSGTSAIDSIYTDANAFFREATYPTAGLKQTVTSVFRRISGDQTAPSIYRLETAFGGGKTHTLIACVHIANRGSEIAEATSGIIDQAYLPAPHSVTVVGIAGDEIPVSRIKGERLVPYTLWGELAYQIGGEDLYKAVRDEAESFAAPGKYFLEKVLGDNKVLIMLDELAQYAARLEMSVPNKGADQLAAFMMALNGYAKTHSGIAIIITLAGAADAFSKQTERLSKLLNQIGDGSISKDDAVSLAEKASHSTTSVIMRDATAVTPVQANEISSVLAKRLFESIDQAAAKEAMEEYTAMYQRNAAMLPEEASSLRFRDRLVANYPFHPTLIDYLNNKLAQAENFQGTRGVLRVLAMTIRSIWNHKVPVSLIHVSDIDMQNGGIVDELLGRTASADLRQVLNADIGSVDTHGLQGGMSNAQRADKRNPHPDGLPLYELTWKTVFLNSLVGRSEGHASKVFGISQQDAIFEVATPVLAPSQVRTALEEISESAFYLRCEDGKYFAHLDPTINSVLAMIRQTIDDNQISQKLRSIVAGLIKENTTFNVSSNVKYPEEIPDTLERPTIGVIALDAERIDLKEMFTMKGENKPRERQNQVLLLVPKTTKVSEPNVQTEMQDFGEAPGTDAKERVESIARQVLAIKALKEKPLAYGIAQSKLGEPEFVERERERELSLNTAVNELYTTLYYPSENGFSRKELRAASGEGGAPVVSQVTDLLLASDDIITSSSGRFGAVKLSGLADHFIFKNGDHMQISMLLNCFFCYRGWPMLADKAALEMLLREGVESGVWVIYKMPAESGGETPEKIYSQTNRLPIDISLLSGGYSIMTVPGARKRGWLDSDHVPDEKVKSVIKEILQTSGAAKFQDVAQAVKVRLANVEDEQVQNGVRDLAQSGLCGFYTGEVNQQAKPSEIIDGFSAYSHDPEPEEVLITRTEQSERGWLDVAVHSLRLEGNEGARKLFPLMRRLGSMYNRGDAISSIETLDISDLKLPDGGTMRFALNNVTPEQMKHLDEIFQMVADSAKVTDETEADLIIRDPNSNCALVKELSK